MNKVLSDNLFEKSARICIWHFNAFFYFLAYIFQPKVKLIPVTIKGTYETLNKVDNKLNFGQEIKLIIDEPIETKDMDPKMSKNFHVEVREMIVKNYESY